MISQIVVTPDTALPQMAMTFDKARHKHLVSETIIDHIVTPAGDVVEGAYPKNTAVPYRDMSRHGLIAIHGDNFARRKNCNVGHRRNS